ncbi:unnamed protein product [Paramecium primaurelia]|uniref:Uncharacterized protein n=1 Tax=Paramecium primaurelia TaxID=5886 RepID=A0A8S1P1T1_PARPR|nr:unnamed protein product [Paramecium primaurelia]
MNSNSKSLSNSIKKDLYLQACKLKENPIDCITEIKTQLINRLSQKIICQNGYKNYFKHENFKQLKHMMFIKWPILQKISELNYQFQYLFNGMHILNKSRQDKQCYSDLRLKEKKELNVNKQKPWNSVVFNLQQKQLWKYDAQQLYTKNTKRLIFINRGWFIQRTQMIQYILANEELIQRQKLKFYQKYYSIMKFKLYQTEHYLEKYKINQQNLIQDQLKKVKIKYLCVCETFNFLNTKTEKHMIYRQQKNCLIIGDGKYLCKNLQIHTLIQGLQQSKRYLKALRKVNLLKLVIQNLRDTKNLIQKQNYTEKYLNKNKLKQLFYYLQNYTQKQKYKRYSLEFVQLFRSKSLLRQLFSHLQLQNKKKRYE